MNAKLFGKINEMGKGVKEVKKISKHIAGQY